MTETEHAQWIRQFWKDKLAEIKGTDRMSNEYHDIAMDKVIKQEVNAVLDKIVDEVYNIDDEVVLNPDGLECKRYVRLIKVVDIIDKYKEIRG